MSNVSPSRKTSCGAVISRQPSGEGSFLLLRHTPAATAIPPQPCCLTKAFPPQTDGQSSSTCNTQPTARLKSRARIPGTTEYSASDLCFVPLVLRETRPRHPIRLGAVLRAHGHPSLASLLCRFRHPASCSHTAAALSARTHTRPAIAAPRLDRAWAQGRAETCMLCCVRTHAHTCCFATCATPPTDASLVKKTFGAKGLISPSPPV